MRRDRQLFKAIDQDRNDERNQSGCCVRLDESGCVQVPGEDSCRVGRKCPHNVQSFCPDNVCSSQHLLPVSGGGVIHLISLRVP